MKQQRDGDGHAGQVPLHHRRAAVAGPPRVEHPREPGVLARMHEHEHDEATARTTWRPERMCGHGPQSTKTVPAGPALSGPHGPARLRRPLGRQRREQAARRLRVAGQQPVGLVEPGAELGIRRPPDRGSCGCRRGTCPSRDQMRRTPGSSGTPPKWSRGSAARRLGQLAHVADQAEPGHVGDGVRPGARAAPGRPRRSASSSTRPRRRPPRRPGRPACIASSRSRSRAAW